MITVDFSPNAFNFFGIDIKWYAIFYMMSFEIGRRLSIYIIKRDKYYNIISQEKMNDFLFILLPIIVIGARAGHVIFYELDYYCHAKLEIFNIRNGGLSFHGGLIAAALYIIYYCRKTRIPIFFMCDILCYCASISLALGRCANFVNQELYGIPTNSNFGVVFAGVDNLVRHPTQIYEALTEGIVNFIILTLMLKSKKNEFGQANISIAFLLNYALARFFIDFLKDDSGGNLTRGGQTLSVVMFVCGVVILIVKYIKKPKYKHR